MLEINKNANMSIISWFTKPLYYNKKVLLVNTVSIPQV